MSSECLESSCFFENPFAILSSLFYILEFSCISIYLETVEEANICELMYEISTYSLWPLEPFQFLLV